MEQQQQQQQQQSRWPYVKAQVPAPPNLMASADIARLLPEDALLSELMEMDGLMDTISEPWPAMALDSGFSNFNFSSFITSPDSSSSFYAVCSPSAPFNAQPSGLVRADSGAMYSLPCNSSGFSPSMISSSTTSLPQLILQEDVFMASASQDIPDKQIDDVLMRLPALFWGLALTENVDCITGPFLEENLIVTGLQSFINMAIECLLLAFSALYLLLLFAPSIVIGTVAEEANIQIRSLWLGLLLRKVEHAGKVVTKSAKRIMERPCRFNIISCAIWNARVVPPDSYRSKAFQLGRSSLAFAFSGTFWVGFNAAAASSYHW